MLALTLDTKGNEQFGNQGTGKMAIRSIKGTSVHLQVRNLLFSMIGNDGVVIFENNIFKEKGI